MENITSAIRAFGPHYFCHSVSVLDPRHIEMSLLVSVAKESEP